jgi:hypothetical protein
MRRGAARSAPVQGRLLRVALVISRCFRRFLIFPSDFAALQDESFSERHAT